MLVCISSELFNEKVLNFHEGLNVVLGDDKASNSIGKSTLLMVIDFVFGGKAFISFNKDVVNQLGHHFYNFSFSFNGTPYFFRRGTEHPKMVFICNSNYQATKEIDLDEYLSFLKTKYLDSDQTLTFRGAAGLFSRVWGKENLEVRKPLHNMQGSSPIEGIELLLRLFKKDKSYRDNQKLFHTKDKEFAAIKIALSNKVVPRITQTQFEENQEMIVSTNAELETIKNELAKFAISISELTNKEVLELSQRKDAVLKLKLSAESDLRRINSSLSETKRKISKSFSNLKSFFPDINETRIAEIETFHSGIRRILKKEIEERKSKLESDLKSLNIEIAQIDKQLESVLSKVKNPTFIVDRVTNLGKRLNQAIQENDIFQRKTSLKSTTKELAQKIDETKSKELVAIQDEINEKIAGIVVETYGQNRKAPTLSITMKNYEYKIVDDTGTGKAYSNLIIFDLALFELTNLPQLTHDSLLFKNIENSAVTELIKRYNKTAKQSFIAIDEINKYGKEAIKALQEQSIIRLTENSMLYIKDWRSVK